MAIRWGVGIVGAGAAAQGIHLPALARLRERFEVRGVVDADEQLAERIARRAGTRVYPGVTELAASPDVDVICICSPERFHVAQLVAASEAGARAVLCEKPLGVDLMEARDGLSRAAAQGTGVFVGTMHSFDPSWERTLELVGELGAILSVDSSAVLPLNDRFEHAAAELVVPDTSAGVRRVETPGETIRRRILLSSIHDIPFIRQLVPDWRSCAVVDAAPLAPIGYTVLAESDTALVQLLSSMRSHWDPQWTLRITGERGEATIAFPPSFVLAGSASSIVRTGDGIRLLAPSALSAYEAEWLRIDAALRGEAAPPEPDSLVDDLDFALRLADGARRFLEAKTPV